jgi:hypothetical protein
MYVCILPSALFFSFEALDLILKTHGGDFEETVTALCYMQNREAGRASTMSSSSDMSERHFSTDRSLGSPLGPKLMDGRSSPPRWMRDGEDAGNTDDDAQRFEDTEGLWSQREDVDESGNSGSNINIRPSDVSPYHNGPTWLPNGPDDGGGEEGSSYLRAVERQQSVTILGRDMEQPKKNDGWYPGKHLSEATATNSNSGSALSDEAPSTLKVLVRRATGLFSALEPEDTMQRSASTSHASSTSLSLSANNSTSLVPPHNLEQRARTESYLTTSLRRASLAFKRDDTSRVSYPY